ncbi:MAG: L,D-transpeptidase family protein [Chloroflexi bacterium]|nr:L,D-transpeptidase family protein [Chloroflexota bacterium]
MQPQPVPALRAVPGQTPRKPRAQRQTWYNSRALFIMLLLAALLSVGVVSAVMFGLGLVYANGVLPGVRVGDVALGGLSLREAQEALARHWTTLIVRDGQRTWAVNPVTLGLLLDAEATARAAYAQGRGTGNAFRTLLGTAQIAPVYRVDQALAEQGLNALAPLVELAPVNAGVRWSNGQVEATPPQDGRALDIPATWAHLNSGTALDDDSTLQLVMRSVAPLVTDAGPLVAQAQQLLLNDYVFTVFDPVTGDVVRWTLSPQQWSAWLLALPDPSNPLALTFTLDSAQIVSYLQSQAAAIFDPSRYINADEAAAAAQSAIAAASPMSYVRVYHHERAHVVQPGETIGSIAWDYGVPYLYIQEANGGISGVSAGQTISIPSPDIFFDYPPLPNKRIVVSISQQQMWVFENGQVIWNWVVSTGISDSPTWPGIYQIISHVPNAYAGNWNLYMPYFMGVYRPIPGADFTNGFHGFPTRGGSQLLWVNDLGTRVTYGCILVADGNIQLLYNWAEDGVVVEIQP